MKKYCILLLLISYSFLFAQNKGATADLPQVYMKPVLNNINNPYLKGITTKLPNLKSNAINIETMGIIKPKENIQTDSIDLTKKWQIIPAGNSSIIKFNYTDEKLENQSVELGISQEIIDAVKTAPLWIQPALLDNIRRLQSARQLTFANMIKNSDKEYRDEIAFQIAHLSPQTLNKINPTLLEKNVEYIYLIAPDLHYVDLVEKGDENNWFTTTKYHVLVNGDTSWVEIPKDIYYWWILMPKLSDEEPSMGPDVYNTFWREYVYNYADKGYPLLKDVLKDVEFMWDCKDHHWANKDTLDNMLPFGDSLFAVQVLGRWVAQTLPERAKQPRPVQPNQILRDHNGNCGELEDLLNAGTRTALLPVCSVGSWPGDHVWNELYWKGHWWYYQVSWACGATDLKEHHTYPNKGLISGWRADGYTWQVNDHYNPTCSLKVKVTDTKNKPVDGAEVVLFSASYHDTHADEFNLGAWGTTDANGELNILLGTNITYGFRVDSKIGHSPTSNNQIYAVRWNELQKDGLVLRNIKINGSMPASLQANTISENPLDKYKIAINYNVPNRILYGGSYWDVNLSLDDYQWSDFRTPGSIDFYICDEENYNKYKQSLPFDAYEVKKNVTSDTLEFSLPKDENFYLIFSNQSKINVSQVLQTDIKLLKNSSGNWVVVDSLKAVNNPTYVDDIVVNDDINLNLSPNPVSSYLDISYFLSKSENIEISIYDFLGNKINTLFKGYSKNGRNSIYWGLSNLDGQKVSNGLYFLILNSGKNKITKSIIINR